MVEFDDIDEGPCPYEMKSSGNEAFKAGDIKEAVETWEMGLERIDQILPSSPFPSSQSRSKPIIENNNRDLLSNFRYNPTNATNDTHRELLELRIILISNLSLAYFKLGKLQRVIHLCNDVLRFRPMNIKALYRKAQAHLELSKISCIKISSTCTSSDDDLVALDQDIGLTHGQVSLRCLQTILHMDSTNSEAKRLLAICAKQGKQKNKWIRLMSGYGDAAQVAEDHQKERITHQEERLQHETCATNTPTCATTNNGPDSMPAASDDHNMKPTRSDDQLCDVDLAVHDTNVALDKVVHLLRTRGAVVIRCGTDTTTLGQAIVECRELYEDGKLDLPASDQNSSMGFLNPAFRLRDDHTAFMSRTIDKNPRCKSLQSLGYLLGKFASSLGKASTESLGLPVTGQTDIQLSYYPGNRSRQTLHLDGGASGQDIKQQFTCLFFLTPQDWVPEKHGGYLRLTIPKDISKPPRTLEEALDVDNDLKIPPLADTLVVLKSDSIWWDLSFVYRESLACLVFYLVSPSHTSEADEKAYDVK